MDKGLSAAARVFIKRPAVLVLKAFLLRNGPGEACSLQGRLKGG